MKLEQYLKRHYHRSTVKIYAFEIDHYLAWMGEQRAQLASYSDVLRYLEYLRARYDKAGTIYRILHAIKRYYQYLVDTEQRSDHPCRLLQLKDLQRHQIQTQDLLNSEELSRLLERKERFASYALRNKLVLSLLVHQAL